MSLWWSRLRPLLHGLGVSFTLRGRRDFSAQLLLAGLQILDRTFQRSDIVRHCLKRLCNFGRKRGLNWWSLRRRRDGIGGRWWRLGSDRRGLLRGIGFVSLGDGLRLRHGCLGSPRVLRFNCVCILWRGGSLRQKLRDELRKTLFGLFTIGMPGRGCGKAGADSQQHRYDAETGSCAGNRIAKRGGVIVRRRGLEQRIADRQEGFRRWRHLFKLIFKPRWLMPVFETRRITSCGSWRQVAKLRGYGVVRIGLRTSGLRSE